MVMVEVLVTDDGAPAMRVETMMEDGPTPILALAVVVLLGEPGSGLAERSGPEGPPLWLVMEKVVVCVRDPARG